MTRLPAELVDAILDALSLDRSNLATCGLVSSSWLARTRFHLFSTVTLTPSRVGKLQEISYAKGSTFLESVGKVVIKDFDNDGEHGALECMVPMLLEATILLLEKYPRLCELQLENLEWTTIPPPLQASLIRRLCRLRTIRRLSLENVTFHDLRDVVHLMSAFPHLQHLVARIYFTKYMEFAISSAQTLHLPHTLRTIDLGTHDATAVILSCRFRSPSLETLRLQNISFASLQYVCDALSTLGSSLRHLALEFSHPKLTGNLSTTKTRGRNGGYLCLENIDISATPLHHSESPFANISTFLGQLRSDHVELIEILLPCQRIEDFVAVNWKEVQNTLIGDQFPSLKNVIIRLNLASSDEQVHPANADADDLSAQVTKHLVHQMLTLAQKRILVVSV